MDTWISLAVSIYCHCSYGLIFFGYTLATSQIANIIVKYGIVLGGDGRGTPRTKKKNSMAQ